MTKKDRTEQGADLRVECMYLMRQCIDDAKKVVKAERLMDIQSHILSIAVAMFNLRSIRGGK